MINIALCRLNIKRIQYVIITFIIFTLCGCNEQPKVGLKLTIDSSVQDESIYTTVSYKAYISSLEKAKSVIKNPFASTKDIVTAKNELETAIDSLKVATKGVYSIEYEFKLIENNSVGNEWQKTVTVNGKAINSGDTITAPFNTTVTVKGTVTEKDSFTDSGYCSFELLLKDNISVSKQITVMENRGRFCGNVALWKMECRANLIERI